MTNINDKSVTLSELVIMISQKERAETNFRHEPSASSFYGHKFYTMLRRLES